MDGKFRYYVENMAKCDMCGYTVSFRGPGDAMKFDGKPCPKCEVDWHEEIAVYDEADVVAAFEAGLRIGKGEV